MTCNRESPVEKIEGLMKASESLLEEIEHMAFLKTLPINFSFKRMNFLRDFSTFLSYLINLLILVFYHYELSSIDYSSVSLVKTLSILLFNNRWFSWRLNCSLAGASIINKYISNEYFLRNNKWIFNSKDKLARNGRTKLKIARFAKKCNFR